MIVAKNILHYLKGTQDYDMFYTVGGEDYLTSFVNNDYSHDHDTIISMCGILYKLGESPIDWSSKRQSIMVLSTTKPKYIMYLKLLKRYCLFEKATREVTNVWNIINTIL
jgi:hypothetical protein